MLMNRYKALLCDLDGCLISGEIVLPGAAELLSRAGDRLYVITNNSTDTPKTLSRRLGALDLTVPPDRIFLAGALAVDQIAARRPGARVRVYGTEAITAHARDAGLTVVHDPNAADVVLLTRDVTFSYSKLTALLAHVHHGAELVVANLDGSHPGPTGQPVPETGALFAMVRSCRPDIAFHVVGKPEPSLYQAVLDHAGAAPREVLCIGDNLDTDGEGARRMGMAFSHVRHHAQGRGFLDLLTES